MEQDLAYLRHLAALGAGDLHPFGAAGTGALIRALELRPGCRVLEVGCGAGRTLARLRSLGVAADGLDLLRPMLRAARRGSPRLRLVRASAGALPLRNECYDRVCMESVIGFQGEADARAILREILRVLKPGGLCVAAEAVWKPGVTPGAAGRIHRSCLEDFGLCQASEQPWCWSDWAREMRSAGFQVIAASPLAPGTVAATPLLQRVAARLLREARLLASRRLRADHARFQRMLKRHAGEGELIEARLFVLRRPPHGLSDPGPRQALWRSAPSCSPEPLRE